MRMILSTVTALFLALFVQQNAWAATQLQASVSANSISLGDLLVLTVTLNDSGSKYRLDTKPLEQDFKVSRPSRSSSNSNINGKVSRQIQWQITLQAKRLGELTIPPLKVANLSTEAIQITVSKPSTQATHNKDNLIFMENSLYKESVYLGQPLIFTSKIYIATDSSELQLSTPELPDAQIAIYGEDKKGQSIRNGIRYHTITRQFKINASKAGTYTIHSPRLSGNANKRVPVNDWHSRVTSSPFNIRGDSLQVTIKAKPADYQGEWLVSEDVKLLENMPLTQQNYRVGEPITRSITLQVAAIDKDRLPNIHFNYPPELRFYPDQDELTEQQIGTLKYAQRTLHHAIIADRAGTLTLPEVRLAWWNSESDKQEFAVLPAQTLTILAAEKQPATPTGNNPTPAAKDNEQQADKHVVDKETLIVWQVVSASLLLALVALSFYHLLYRRAQNAAKNNNRQTASPLNQAHQDLQKALSQQHASLAYRALLHYAQNEFPTLTSLSHLPELMNIDQQEKAELAAELQRLENACATLSPTWNSAKLAKLFSKHNQQQHSCVNEDIMNLNPS